MAITDTRPNPLQRLYDIVLGDEPGSAQEAWQQALEWRTRRTVRMLVEEDWLGFSVPGAPPRHPTAYEFILAATSVMSDLGAQLQQQPSPYRGSDLGTLDREQWDQLIRQAYRELIAEHNRSTSYHYQQLAGLRKLAQTRDPKLCRELADREYENTLNVEAFAELSELLGCSAEEPTDGS